MRGLVMTFVLLVASVAQAVGVGDAEPAIRSIARKVLTVPADTIDTKVVDVNKMSQKEYEEYLLTQPIDTTRSDTTTVAFSVQVLARPKGDRVLLRWAPDEFAPWYLANR